MKDCGLTILMPCLNEERTIAACIAEAQGYITRRNVVGEVLIADNGSTDRSVAIAESLGARVVHCPEKGYGNALRCGLAAAYGDCIIMGDCDQSYDFSAIDEMHDLLKGGVDVVIGDRFAERPVDEAMSFSHRLGVPFLSWAARVRFGCTVRDFHCGLRGIRREVLEKLDLRCGGMEFATEFIAKATRAGLTIGETPVILRPDGRDGPSHLRTVRDGLRHLWCIVRGG